MRRRRFLSALAGAAAAAWLPSRAGALAPAEPRRVLYIAGHLSSHDPQALERTIDNLGASAFNVVIVAFVHASAAARLRFTYNGLAAGGWHPQLPALIARLRTGFAVPKKVLISIGGWGNRADFEALRAAGIENAMAELDRQIAAPLGLDGIDLDLEPTHVADNTPAGWREVHADLGATLVAVTRAWRRRHPDHLVTHAPIASVAAEFYLRDGRLPGVEGSLLDACGEALSWLNVQLYEAGDIATGMTPVNESIADYWNHELRGSPRLVPGFEPRRQSWSFCRQTMATLPARDYFLWEYGQVATRMKDWEALA